jgi:hypothetical protein
MSDDIVPVEVRPVLTVGSAKDSLPLNFERQRDATGAAPPSFTTSSESSAGYQKTRSASGKPAQPGRDRESRSRTPEARDELRRLWGQALRKANGMVLAAQSGDPIEMSNATSDLDQVLSLMWDRREFREIDWCHVLNFLQGVLRTTWVRSGGFETFSAKQCMAIEEIVKSHLGPSTMDVENSRATIQLLETCGLDPWAPISRGPEE